MSLRPLIIAEHASAIFGGEALIPYQYFKHFRQLNVDAHLLVHERTRKELCDAFPNDVQRLHFVADSRVNIWCCKMGRFMPDRLAVFTFGAMSHLDTQIRQRRLAKALIREHGFNIVHEPIPVSPKQPSMMFGLSVPVIMGPMNGGMDYPLNYDPVGRFERAIVSLLRRTSAFWNVIMPGKRKAALIMVANKRTYDALPFGVRTKRILQFAENGVDVDRFNGERGVRKYQNFSIAYVGRLVDFKRVDLLIDACAKLVGTVDFRVDLIGDGPLRGALERQVEQLSLTSRAQFHGWLPQAAVAEQLRTSDIMVLPSMRECGGAVVLEAMASGIPVVATGWGGPTDYITKETGILIPPNTADEFVNELAQAISLMARNPEMRIKMGQAGRTRALALYGWRVKAKSLLRIYEDIVSVSSVQAESA